MYQNGELQRMLAELDIALQGADQNNQTQAKASAFRQGAQMAEAKDKMQAQAAGAGAYEAAKNAGNTGSPVTPYGGPGNTPGDQNFSNAFDKAMANPTPMDATQANDQLVQQELANREQLRQRMAAEQAGGVDPRMVNAVSQPTVPPGGLRMSPGPTPAGMSPEDVAALNAIATQQNQGMGVGQPPATQMAGASTAGQVPVMPQQAPPPDPGLAAYLRLRNSPGF